MAEQQGKYLARVLNAQAGQLEAAEAEPFQYRHLGSMASIGAYSWAALLEGGSLLLPHVCCKAAAPKPWLPSPAVGASARIWKQLPCIA